MQYSKGSLGKVLVARFDNGDDIIKELKDLIRKEEINTGTVTLLGALRDSEIVAGPKKTQIPPEPYWLKFNDAWETLGFGVIAKDEENNEPSVHLHINAGQHEKVITGCLRKSTKVFLVIEAVIQEICGISAVRKTDKELGIKKLEVC